MERSELSTVSPASVASSEARIERRCEQEDVQAAGGGVLVVGDQLLTYVSGRSKAMKLLQTGLLTLRRDGCKMLTLSRF